MNESLNEGMCVQDPMKWKAECCLLPQISCFLQKQADSEGLDTDTNWHL